MTSGDITGESSAREAYSFFGRSRFDSDIGRGNLFITKRTVSLGDGNPSSKRRKNDRAEDRDDILVRGFYELSAKDQDTLVEQRFPNVLANLRKLRKCHACDAAFTFEAELGRRRCVWHPGVLRPGNVWSCCRDPYEAALVARRRRNGCSRCDHNDAAHNQRDIATIKLPGIVARHIDVPKEAIRPSDYKPMPGMTDTMEIELATSERLPRPVGRHPYQTETHERPLAMRHQLAEVGYAVLH